MKRKMIRLSILIIALSAAFCLASCDSFFDDPMLHEGINTHTHEFGEWSEDSATCDTPGIRERKCASCGDVETVETAALGHDMIAYKDRDAGCTESGYSGYSVCARCEYSEGEIIEAKGHVMSDWVVTLEPTCVDRGSQMQTCSVCTETVTESVKASGHSMVKYTDSEPTCTEGGYSGYKECSKCDYFEGEKLDPSGHTPDENGECSVCHLPTEEEK